MGGIELIQRLKAHREMPKRCSPTTCTAALIEV